jgi:hypothetical protein
MNGCVVLPCLLVMVICCSAAAGQAIEDSRFARAYDKDRPHGFEPRFVDRAAWQIRAELLRQQVLVAQGLWPMPPKTPLNAVIHGKIDRDDYTIEKVYFASMPGHYVTGNLYRPKGRSGRLPAVLCPYGHWPNGRLIWRDDNGVNKDMASGAERDPIAARTPLQANCAMLARMGCVVFQYDMVGYCDSAKIPHREGFLDPESVLRLQSFMGLQTWNSVRSMDFITGLPDVDPARVAITGSSSGGTQTISLCAVDGRVAVAFPIVMVSMNMQGGCVCENAPLHRVFTNNVELACLFAPKPQGMAAANDWTVDFETRGLPEMKIIWGLFGAADRVGGKHINYPHNHNLHSREMQYNWLNKHLKLGLAEPVAERPFEPVPPAELSVFDAEHPRPADELDAAALRKSMTRTSDEQLAALSRDELHKTVRLALEAMIVDRMPAPADVEVNDGLLTRRGAGERLPFRTIHPANWNGRVVVWAHPNGKASLSEAQKLVDGGYAVVAIDPFMSDAFKPLPKPATRVSNRSNPNPAYAAYTLGYNRSVLAERVHDLLSAVAMAHATSGAKSVYLIGLKEQGIAALLARAIAGDTIARAAIDLNGFDFDQVTRDTDPMLLPGALKYGGVFGFAQLCPADTTLLCNMPETSGRRTTGLHIGHDSGKMIDWLMETQ